MHIKPTTLGMILTVLFFLTSKAVSAQDAEPKIVAITLNNEEVSIILHCREPYLAGSNRYNLNIGEDAFFRSFHSYEKNNNILTFLLSADAFSLLQDDLPVSLSYGSKHVAINLWNLGHLDKSMLHDTTR